MDIYINTEYITLGQFLKLTGQVSSGGEVRFFLENKKVLVNDIKENRKGKKIYNNDIVVVEKEIYKIVYVSRET